ncbi:MAG: hypothetical protein KGH98_04465 [Candidatus Micrarchaeota archaeon]|nr:hypothetical protein [Candidatus Micrarchaeota archaeon]
MANNTVLIAIVAIVVIIVVAGVLLTQTGNKGAAPATSSSGSSGSGQQGASGTSASGTGSASTSGSTGTSSGGSASSGTTSSGSGSSSTSGYKAGGGAGQSYISEAQAVSLMGPGGSYNATGAANSTVLAQYISKNGTYANGYFKGNITGLWIAGYTINASKAGTGGKSLLQVTLQAPSPSVAKYLYMRELANSTASNGTSSYTVINATDSGMTYSFGSAYIGDALIGYKGSELTSVVTIFATVNQTSLADIVAQDMP